MSGTVMKIAHNNLGPNKCMACTAPKGASYLEYTRTQAASPPPSLLHKSLRQVYKGPVRHRGTAADPWKSMQLPVV